MTNEEIYRALSEPFPESVEREISKSGMRLVYIPVSEVINRMNRVLGVEGWSQEVIYVGRDATDIDFVIAHIRVTAIIGGVSTYRDGYGGQKVKRAKSDGQIVDLSNEYKSAISDAFKKACQGFGVGLYIARPDEAIAIEAAEEMASMQSNMSDEAKQLYENFIGLRNKLNEEGLKQIRDYWNTLSGGRPVPKPHEFTIDELERLVTEAVRIIFDGEHDIQEGDEQP